MKDLRGTGVALVTPFAEDGSVDHPALRKVVRHVINGGVNYLVGLGTTGESVTLSNDEQHEVIRTILAENSGQVPVVLGAGGNNTANVMETMRDFEAKYSPAAFLSVCPYYNKPNQEGLFRHFEAVSGATDTPVILYNVPGRTSSNLLPSTVKRIAFACPSTVAIKEASGNVEQGMEVVGSKRPGFLVLSGDDTLAISQIAAGFDGVISVMANAMPREFTKIVNHSLAGEFNEAQKAHYAIFGLMQLNFTEGNPAGVKAMLELQGICSRKVRLPLAEATDELVGKMKQMFEMQK